MANEWTSNVMPVLREPNVLITGTPGVGKTTICEQIADKTGLRHQNVSQIAMKNEFTSADDDLNYDSAVLDEDKVIDFLERTMKEGGNVVEYHGCDFFPERWFDAVFVVRTDNTILYDRLNNRGYNEKKIEDNIQCEIFQTILEEARAAYRQEIVFELQNDTMEQMEANVKKILKWIKNWKKS